MVSSLFSLNKNSQYSFIKNSIAVTSVAKTLGIGWKEIIKNIKNIVEAIQIHTHKLI